MSQRTIAIGDIHGCSLALATLLKAVDPGPDDLVITLGDYVDRGFDSRGALDQLLALARRCRLVPLLGNHDEMVLDLLQSRAQGRLGSDPRYREWLGFGGIATLQSYGEAESLGEIPADHVAFLQGCRLFHETDRHIFLHGNYEPELALEDQPRDVLLWRSLRQETPGPHVSGKTVIVGHTSQKSGEVLDLGYLKCIDTYCYGGGWLTALDVESGRVWQANDFGLLRK